MSEYKWANQRIYHTRISQVFSSQISSSIHLASWELEDSKGIALIRWFFFFIYRSMRSFRNSPLIPTTSLTSTGNKSYFFSDLILFLIAVMIDGSVNRSNLCFCCFWFLLFPFSRVCFCVYGKFVGITN